MTTISVIKADVGGFPGHVSVHPDLIAEAERQLGESRESGLVSDYRVTRVGDDLQLLLLHDRGADDRLVHELAWNTFSACAEVARRLGLHGAGQDLLADAFTGTVRGMGPGVAEMTFVPRPSEPIVVFMADKASAGAWNLPLYRSFADPFTTAGLVIADALAGGFRFEVHDVVKHTRVFLDAPEESYQLLALIGNPYRYVVKAILHRGSSEPAAVSSVERLSLIAGRYVGKDDPVCIVRCQGSFPAVGEVLEPYASPHLVAGWMRGSHYGPLIPVPLRYASPTRFDGPPRVIALGFQVTAQAMHGPVDLFDDIAFDTARTTALEIADYLRRQGPFVPHRLGEEEMEYTTLPQVLAHLASRFEPVPGASRIHE